VLLHRQSQITLDFIPWFNLLEWTAATDTGQNLADAQAADLATLALRHFAGTALPYSELAEFYKFVGEDVPLTYELAVDYFRGSFSPVFQRAAQEAAIVVGGTLYARYYDIDYSLISQLRTREEDNGSGQLRTTVPDFDALVHARAGVTATGWERKLAINGKVDEQAQIVTTHNLAALIKRGVAIDPLTQAQAAWDTSKAHLAKAANGHPLRHRKNAAFAWRQTLFYLSLASPATVNQFIENNQMARGLTKEVAGQAAAILQGLTETVHGLQPSAGPFLGWVS
jgi:hypothetical protein